MWQVKIFVLIMTLIYVYAIPRCTFYAEDRNALVCLSNDEDTNLVLKKGVVSEHRNTKCLAMKNCKISSVDCDAFQGLSEMTKLDLSGNSIKTLMPCALGGLNQLTTLNISYNKISEINSGFFDAVNSIEIVDLKGNQIKTVETGSFDRLNNLKDLDLSNNALQSSGLNRHIFEHTNQLKSLDFSRNDMSQATEDLLTELPSLESLKLDRCFLSEVPTFAVKPNLRTLKVLILTTNQISNLNDPIVFVNLDDLEILNLAGNAIESVSENVFAPLRKVKTIVLKHNRLSQLPEKLFQNMPKLVSVDLSFNVIKKIEVSPFRNTPMKNLNISGNKLMYLPENFCKQLREAGGRLTKFLFAPNPWQCGCLRELMEEVTSLGLVYNTSKYNGKTAVCKMNGNNFSCVRS